ncbi:hypothetical protein HDU86_001415 [Geranomyces michiganensis]|nr:hypothetical protein HDU86_001415 [Geranomyces michiganensis]
MATQRHSLPAASSPMPSPPPQPPASVVDPPFTSDGNDLCTTPTTAGEEEDGPRSIRFLSIFRLRHGVSPLKFLIYLLAAALGICIFVFLNASQGFVLSNIVHIPAPSLGNASGSLTFYDECVSVVCVWLWGIASDRVGRRGVYGGGFVIMGVALAAFTFPTRLYPELLLVRLLFAVGGAASSAMMTAVLADYAADEPVDCCDGDDVEAHKSLLDLAKEGVRAARDMRVLLGYAGSFLARGDTIILTLFLPLWVYRHYLDSGMCQAPGGADDPDIKTHCREAYLKASVLSGVAQTCALVGAPLFGYLTDTLYRPIPILLAGLIGGISYLLVYAQRTPTAGIMFLYMSLIGFAEIGLVVGSLALVTASYVPYQVRGSVAGVSSLAGALGILINTKLGGALFDSWVPTAPFFVMAVGHAAFCVLAGVVVVRDFVRARRMVVAAARSGDVGCCGGVVAVMRREFEAAAIHL